MRRRDIRPQRPFGGNYSDVQVINPSKSNMLQVAFLQGIVICCIKRLVHKFRDSFRLSRGSCSANNVLDVGINWVRKLAYTMMNHTRSSSSSGVISSFIMRSA